MALADVINLNISRSAPAVSRQGFGVALILGPTALGQATWSGTLLKYYTQASAMLTDGFTSSSPEYLAATSLMSQANKPTKFGVGKRQTTVAQIMTFTPTVSNATVYSVTINGQLVTFTSSGAATAANIVTGLLAAFAALSPAITLVAASGTTTLILTSTQAGIAFSAVSSSTLPGVTSTANVGAVEDLAAIAAVDSTWYATILTSRDINEIQVVAAWTETQRKIFGACTGDAAVIAAGSTDVASILQAKSYARTFYIYSGNNNAYPEAAWLGGILPLQPGSVTFKFKTLAGVTTDNLTPTQFSTAKGKNANIYTNVGGLGMTEEGVVVSGEFIDVIMGIDWIYANLLADIFQNLMNVGKIPYTDVGAGAIESAIRNRLRLAQTAGILSTDQAPVVTVPLVAAQASSDKSARRMAGITFSAVLAGAIHLVTISGNITY